MTSTAHSPGSPARRARRLGLLHDHDFRRLFYADIGSQLGTHVLRLALPLAAIFALDASELEVGILTACMTVAIAVVGLPAGAVVDRLRRRDVMIVSDLARAAVLVSIPVAWWQGALSMAQLYTVAVVVGIFTVLFDVAYQSYLPHLVGRENLVEGNAKLEAVYSVSLVGGRAAGGPLIQALTAPVATLTTVGGFLASAWFIWSIRRPEPAPQTKRVTRLGSEIAAGLRFVTGHRLLRTIAAYVATLNLFIAVSGPVMLIFLARTLGLSAAAIGLLMALGGVGALLGTLVATRAVRWIGHGRVMWVSLVVTMPSAFLVPLAEADWRLALVGVYQVLFWAGVLVNSVAQVSFRQAVTPEPMLGRMNATMRFLVWGMTPLGAVLGGALASLVGTRPALWISAVGLSVAFVWVLASPLRSMTAVPDLAEL